jgi:hypothetical protein
VYINSSLGVGLEKPCIMDVKMGAKTYGPDASQEKILKQEASYAGRAIYRHFQATQIHKYCTFLSPSL